MSLVELLVVMIIFSVLIVITFTVLVTVQRQTVDTMARNDSVDQARLAMAQIDRRVRSGDRIFAVTPDASGLSDRLVVLNFYNGDGAAQSRCIEWQATGGVLRTRTFPQLWATAGGVSPWLVTARFVPSGQRPFRVTADSGSVDVRLKVDPTGAGLPSELVSTLTTRNLDTTGVPCTPAPTP